MARTLLTAGRIEGGALTDLAVPADTHPLAFEQLTLRYGPELVVHTLEATPA